jgi:hypothetical protein
MKLYADAPGRRARQTAADLAVVTWVLVWLVLARVVHGATMLLAAPGEKLDGAGAGLAARLRDAGSAVSDTPLVGDRLREPFDGAGAAADQLSQAGASQVEAVGTLAFWLAFAVAAIPILLALAFYVPGRWRFVREVTAGQQYVDATADLDLFALRAMSGQPLHRLAVISDDPVAAWRRGDRDVIAALATLELRDVGLSPPAEVTRAG